MWKFEVESETLEGLVDKIGEGWGQYAKLMEAQDEPVVKASTAEPVQPEPQAPVQPEPQAPVQPEPQAPVQPELPEEDEPEAEGSEELLSVPDARGIPWDARIHSSSKKKNKDGTWKRKKFVTPAEVREVELELRGVEPLVPYQLRDQQADTPFKDAEKAVPQKAIDNPAATKPEPLTISFESFKVSAMSVLAQMLKDKWIDQKYIASLAEYFGVDQLWKALADEENIKAIYESLVGYGLIKVGA